MTEHCLKSYSAAQIFDLLQPDMVLVVAPSFLHAIVRGDVRKGLSCMVSWTDGLVF